MPSAKSYWKSQWQGIEEQLQSCIVSEQTQKNWDCCFQILFYFSVSLSAIEFCSEYNSLLLSTVNVNFIVGLHVWVWPLGWRVSTNMYEIYTKNMVSLWPLFHSFWHHKDFFTYFLYKWNLKIIPMWHAIMYPLKAITLFTVVQDDKI